MQMQGKMQVQVQMPQTRSVRQRECFQRRGTRFSYLFSFNSLNYLHDNFCRLKAQPINQSKGSAVKSIIKPPPGRRTRRVFFVTIKSDWTAIVCGYDIRSDRPGCWDRPGSPPQSGKRRPATACQSLHGWLFEPFCNPLWPKPPTPE
jgi:hypothetical protein